MANNLWSARDIAMKLGVGVPNRIIVKFAKLQAFTICMKKVI